MPRVRSEKAAALADQAGQWIKCRVDGRPRYYGIRSESEPGHYHLVDLHTCCCRWARARDADRDPCSHILAVRIHVRRVQARRARAALRPAA